MVISWVSSFRLLGNSVSLTCELLGSSGSSNEEFQKGTSFSGLDNPELLKGYASFSWSSDWFFTLVCGWSDVITLVLCQYAIFLLLL